MTETTNPNQANLSLDDIKLLCQAVNLAGERKAYSELESAAVGPVLGRVVTFLNIASKLDAQRKEQAAAAANVATVDVSAQMGTETQPETAKVKGKKKKGE